jgi:branched-chain amino acid transport system substrate-binding protein
MKKKGKRGVNRREFIKGMGALGAAVTFSGFPRLAHSAEEVKFGVVEPLTGPLAPLGLSDRRGYEQAVDEINAAGGIKSLGGAKLRMMLGDSEGKPEVGMAEAEKHIQRGAVAIMGAFQSAVVFANTQVAEKYKTPHIVAIGVAEAITQRGFKYTFRPIATDAWHIRDEFEYLTDIQKKKGIKIKTIGIFYEDTLWGQSSSKAWKRLAAEKGYSIVADLPYPHATSDVTGVMSKLKAANPDVALTVAYISDAILVTKTMKDLDFNTQAIIGMGGGHQDDAFIKTLGKLAEYVSVCENWENDLKIPGVKEANENFLKRNGVEMDCVASMCHTCVYVLKDALERAASTDREKLREALTKTNLRPGEKGNIQPSSIIFDETGQNKEARTVIAQIQNGKRRSVFPAEFAASEPIWPMPKWKDRK